MSRYIDAEWIRNIYADFEHYENRDDWTTPITNVLAVIDDAPSIDIVFCKECIFGTWDDDVEMYDCFVIDGCLGEAHHYCGYGERKECK